MLRPHKICTDTNPLACFSKVVIPSQVIHKCAMLLQIAPSTISTTHTVTLQNSSTLRFNWKAWFFQKLCQYFVFYESTCLGVGWPRKHFRNVMWRVLDNAKQILLIVSCSYLDYIQWNTMCKDVLFKQHRRVHGNLFLEIEIINIS